MTRARPSAVTASAATAAIQGSLAAGGQTRDYERDLGARLGGIRA